MLFARFTPMLLAIAVGVAQTPSRRIPTKDSVSPQGMPAVVMSKTEPVYTDEAKRAKAQGTVTLLVQVGRDGTASNMRVLKPMGMGLDEAAMDAVRQWEFRAATKDSALAAVDATVDVHFRLPDRAKAVGVRSVVFPARQGISRPVLESADLPESGLAAVATTLEIAVSPEGKVTRVMGGSPGNTAAANAVKNWRFQPAQQGGKPVAATGTVEIGPGPR